MTRRVVRRMIVTAASVTIGLALAEAAARSLDGPPDVVCAVRREVLYGRPDADLGWTPAPNLAKFHVSEVDASGRAVLDYTVTTNARGFRGAREYAVPKPARVHRIVVVGDSFTWGQAVDEDETIPARLERHGVEAPNLGVISYGAGQMLRRLERDGLPLEPDQVLCCLIADDVHRDTEPWSINGYGRPLLMEIGDSDYVFPAPTGGENLPRTRLPGGTRLPRPRGLARVVADAALALGVGWRWRLFEAEMAEMARVVRARGARLTVAVLDCPGRFPLVRVLEDVGRRWGFVVVDTSDAWAGHAIVDGHPDARGYELIVARLLERAPWLEGR